MIWNHLPVVLPALALAGLLAAPSPAAACGGTFCDAPPPNRPFAEMPVDQTGEEVLFRVADGEVEVHIRIAYDGEAERFAWLVPLQALPEVSIGSEPMFTILRDRTWPTWSRSTDYECNEDDPDWTDPNDPNDDWGGDGDPGDGDGDPDPGPEIVLHEVVGAFELVVLQGGTAAEVIQFLDDNGYQQDPEAEPILQEYLDEGFLFAAIKLTADATTDQIHPIVFRFPGDEPCVPLRLTRIAAKEDMSVRVYLIGAQRWVPGNYAHVVLNPLAFDWTNPSDLKYTNLVSAAIDEAGGRAFVTDYFGSTGIFPTGSVYSLGWDSSAFLGLDPVMAVAEIIDQGLETHPLLTGLMLEFIPPPDGVDPFDYWNNIEFFADMVNLDAWDDVAFAAALEERVIAPGLAARDLLEAGPQVSVMHTMISPVEMIEDPIFYANDGDPLTIDNRSQVTPHQILCGGHDDIYSVRVEGQTYDVCAPNDQRYPDWDGAMPAALRIEQFPMSGPPQALTDNQAIVDSLYEAREASVSCESENPGDGDGDGGESDSGGGTGDAGVGLDGGDGTASCACSTDDDDRPLGLLALGLLALGLLSPWRRRAR